MHRSPRLIIEQSSHQISTRLGDENAATNCSALFVELVPNLGSPEDIEETAVRPLHRALYCLQHALQALHFPVRDEGNGHEWNKEYRRADCLEAILTNTAYVHLELRDPYSTLKVSERFLQRRIPRDDGVNVGSNAVPDHKAQQRLFRPFITSSTSCREDVFV